MSYHSLVSAQEDHSISNNAREHKVLPIFFQDHFLIATVNSSVQWTLDRRKVNSERNHCIRIIRSDQRQYRLDQFSFITWNVCVFYKCGRCMVSEVWNFSCIWFEAVCLRQELERASNVEREGSWSWHVLGKQWSIAENHHNKYNCESLEPFSSRKTTIINHKQHLGRIPNELSWRTFKWFDCCKWAH